MVRRRQEFQTLTISHSPSLRVMAGDSVMRDGASATTRYCFGLDKTLNYLHFADDEALLRGNSANMQIKTKRLSSFAKKDSY